MRCRACGCSLGKVSQKQKTSNSSTTNSSTTVHLHNFNVNIYNPNIPMARRGSVIQEIGDVSSPAPSSFGSKSTRYPPPRWACFANGAYSGQSRLTLTQAYHHRAGAVSTLPLPACWHYLKNGWAHSKTLPIRSDRWTQATTAAFAATLEARLARKRLGEGGV